MPVEEEIELLAQNDAAENLGILIEDGSWFIVKEREEG